MIKLNGIQIDVSDISVAELLTAEKYDLKRIAVELNGEIIPKSGYDSTILKDGNSIEAVSFVGGG